MSVAMTSPERRETPRLRVESLVLIDIGEDNAGIISDISEGGLCFQVAAPIEEGGTVDFRLRPDDLSQGAAEWYGPMRPKREAACLLPSYLYIRESRFTPS